MITSSGNIPNQIKLDRVSSGNRCMLKFNDAVRERRFKLASSDASLADLSSKVFNRATSCCISCRITAQEVPPAIWAAANSSAKGK